jgi:type II secretion system protein H
MRVRLRDDGGYTMTELLVVLGVIAIVSAIVMLSVLTALPALQLRWAAAEIQAGLNRARTLALSTRQNVCVEVLATGYRFRRGTCAGVVWADAQTDSNGLMRVSGNPTLTSTASPLFTPFGNAPQTGIVTVVAGSGSQTVTVTASGRVTIP